MVCWVIGMKTDKSAASEPLLCSVKLSKAIVKLAVPATLALLAKAVYNIVDTAYIGMLDSDIALAAVGVTLPLLLIMVSVENIFVAGASVLAGICFSQPAADLLTILICALLIKPMKRMASGNMAAGERAPNEAKSGRRGETGG